MTKCRPATRSLPLAFILLLATLASRSLDAQQLAPNPSLARSYVASAQKDLSTGDAASARANLALAIKADSKYAEAYILLGLVEFQRGDTASSIQQYKKALALQPRSYTAHYNLALAYLRQRRLQDGRLHLEQAVKLDPHQGDAAYDLGIVLLELGKPALALPHLLQARTLTPQRPDVAFNIIRANLETGRILAARNEAHAATQFVSDFQWNAAVGQLFLKNAQPQDAIVYLRQALLVGGDDPGLRSQLAAAYLGVGEAKQVLDLIPQATTGEDHYLLASAFYLDHRFEDADRESELALASTPENPRALVLRVRVLQRAGQQEAALQLAQKATTLAPTWDEPFYLAGVSAYFIRHYSDADQYLGRAVELNPNSARALFLRGIALASQEKVAEAEHSIRRAITLQPNNARFHCHLGILLMRKNDYVAAEQSFRKAVALAPAYGLSHYELGKLLARSNQLEAAAAELNEAVRRDPSLGSAYYQLARVYAKLGDSEKSDRALASFHKLYQDQANDSPEVADDARKETQSPDAP